MVKMDLKSYIHQHAVFLDKMVELIPARFYLPSDDNKPWFQGLSKGEKAAAKQESKENIKKSRRDRMDPEKSTATTLDLLKQKMANEKANMADKSNSEGDDVEVEINPMVAGLEDADRSVTYEELRQKLRHTIESLRAIRHDSNRSKKTIERKEYRETHQKKRKRNDVNEKEAAELVKKKVEEDATEAAKGLSFTHVKLGDDEEHEKKRQKKLSKFQELEKAKKLEEAKKDPEKGEIVSKKHAWSAAASRAAGIKIHDDPSLLKKSIHKDKKKHEKNVGKWKERTESRDKMKAEKQQKRSGNIAERSKQKKMRKIAKREKKLMRPGFEGRKEGFITKG